MGKFCFICGKKTDKLKEGYCKNCYCKKIIIPKKVEIIKCMKCNLFRIKNIWEKTTIEDIILSNINGKAKIKKSDKDFIYNVFANGEKYEVRARAKEIVCPICARKFSDYYEAVVQVRGNYNDNILDFIDERLSALSEKDRKAFYTIRKLEEGIDIRLGSKVAALKLVESTKRKFGCEIKKSFELVSRKKGIDICRNVICIRF